MFVPVYGFARLSVSVSSGSIFVRFCDGRVFEQEIIKLDFGDDLDLNRIFSSAG